MDKFMNRSIRLTAIAAALLFTATGCGTAAPPPADTSDAPLEWIIVDDYTGERCGWNGNAMNAVFSALDEKPLITRYTGDQDKRLSQMLDHGTLPDLITVPADSSLSEKLCGSAALYGINELSPELYTRIPEETRRYWQRQQEDLYYLPGGYVGDAERYRPIAVEGVYVREEYYSLLGEPPMDTLPAFRRALESFVRLMTENQIGGSEELLPLVFGVNNAGLCTVEHMRGLPLFHREGSTRYHRLFSGQLASTLQFFDALDVLSAYPIFDDYSDTRLAELLKANVFVYIGPTAFIESFNLNNPRCTYRAITPPFAADGYLEAQNRYGGYKTFVSRSCDAKRAAGLLLALTSDEASSTLMYGIEDQDWVTVNGVPTPLKTTVADMEEDMPAFLRRTGIAAFPFLSHNGMTNPYRSGNTARTRDLSAEKVFFAPDDYHGYYVRQMDAKLTAYYAEVAGTSVGISDVLARVDILRNSKEPLTVSR